MAASGKSENANDSATLCANNCGFYGNPNNHNLCSLCYAAFLKQNLENSARTQTSIELGKELVEIRDEEPNLGTRRSLSPSEISKDLGTELVETRDEEPKLGTGRSESYETCVPAADLNDPAAKTKNRCKTCKKKVGLLGFKCRCGDSFCSKHRYPEEHSCGVDHKAVGREILAKQIVECKADKLEFRV